MKCVANERGLTLLEVLLSFSILSVVFVTFMAFFTNAFQYNSLSSDEIQGTNLVRATLAELKENSAKRVAMEDFLGNVRNGDLSMSQPAYAALSLTGTVGETRFNEEDYYTLQIQHFQYKVFVHVKRKPDFLGTSISLYRLYVQVFNDTKLLSDTYAYFEYDSEEENNAQ